MKDIMKNGPMNPANFRCKSIEETVLHYTESTFKETIGKNSFWIHNRNSFVPLGQLVCFSHGWAFQSSHFSCFPLCLEIRKLKIKCVPSSNTHTGFQTWILWANVSPSSFHLILFFIDILRFKNLIRSSYYELCIFKCYFAKSCKNSPNYTLYNK